MKKYVVKNCPNVYGSYKSDYDCDLKDNTCCENFTNCLIKQVIEKNKEQMKIEENQRYKTNGYILAKDILQLFDIQEVD
jgi:hypothetical protein